MEIPKERPQPKKKAHRLKRIGDAPKAQDKKYKPIPIQNQRQSRINELILGYLSIANPNGAYEDAIKHHVLIQMRLTGEAGVMMDEDVYDFVEKQFLTLKALGLLREYKVQPSSSQIISGDAVVELYGWQLKKKYQQGIRMFLELTKNAR